MHATIDVKTHKEAIPVLQHPGLMEKIQFEKDCESAITIEETRAHTQPFY